jgi:HSP20 family protein
MAPKKETALVPDLGRDPFSRMREMVTELDHFFRDPGWPSFSWPTFPAPEVEAAWYPEIDVFEKDNRLVTRIDLPGMKKEDVKVEVTDGRLAVSGERKREAEEKTEQFYRSEREYGSFYRAVPLPESVKLDDVKATFADGVLEVSVPLPKKQDVTPRTVEIQEPVNAAKTAA